MIFEFQLTPVEDIQPWGEFPNKNLHWFGFTDGKYRLKVGEEYLLNYSEEYKEYCIKKFPDYCFNTTFVEYQVVRFWEDILEMLPSILEPVPNELQHFLNSDYENYSALRCRADDWQESETAKGISEDESWKLAEKVDYWLAERWFDTGYLIHSPTIWIWSDEKDVIFSWDNGEIKVENIPVWSAVQGNYRINKVDFINEVRKFDNSLISQMNDRVETICRNWNKPEIKVDFEYLKNEQKNRSTWFEAALNGVRKTNWNEVVSAIEIINP